MKRKKTGGQRGVELGGQFRWDSPKCSSYQKRQNLQNLVFPDGLSWDKENDKPRTIRENTALMYMRLITKHLQESPEQEKTGKSCDFSGLVEQVLEISNGFIEGFKAVIAFCSVLK